MKKERWKGFWRGLRKYYKMIREVGLIGLGKMGFRMAERLLDHDFKVIVSDVDSDSVMRISRKGGIGKNSIKEMTEALSRPRCIMLSVPAEAVDRVISELVPFLSEGDIIVDSGNSFFRDSQNRANKLKKKGVCFLDVGVSGGVGGARNGACLMIGGEEEVYLKIEKIFAALSKEGSYKYLGKSGAGHLVKGYHNLVEYGYLQALAEGLLSVNALSEKEDMGIDLKGVCDIWNKGSIVESRLVGDARVALEGRMEGISGSVRGQTQKEMEFLVEAANGIGAETPCCKAAIDARIASQSRPCAVGKLINAIRNVFGGHEEWKKS